MRMVLILKEAGLPTKTSWEKGKGEPSVAVFVTLYSTGGGFQRQRR
jgi:hypothetical protein